MPEPTEPKTPTPERLALVERVKALDKIIRDKTNEINQQLSNPDRVIGWSEDNAIELYIERLERIIANNLR